VYDGSDYAGSCTPDGTGTCEVGFVVPAGPGGPFTVEADGESSGLFADTTFTETGSLALNPAKGAPGSSFEGEASGFEVGETVDFAFGGTPVGSCSTGYTGACTASLLVPAAAAGPSTVTATGETSGLSASAGYVVNAVTINPTSGPAGTVASVEALGFLAGETVEIAYDSHGLAQCVAGPDGSCSASITVPGGEAGPYAVFATGLTSELSSRTVFQETAALALSPSSGPADSTFVAAATGFQPAEQVNVDVDGHPVTTCTAGSDGSCSVTLGAPAAGAGSYAIEAAGASSGLDAAATFVETGPSLVLSSSSGPAGSVVTATVANYLGGETVDFDFDGALVGSCVASPSGACSGSVTVPAEAGGTYDLVAIGTSSNEQSTAPFSETPTLAASPGTGVAGSTFQVVASDFAAGDTVAITYGSTADGSCTADVAGDCTAEVAVPAGAAGTYTVTGTGTSGLSASTTFTQIVALALTPSNGATGTTVHAVAGGFQPAETVDVTFAGNLVSQCLAGTDGSCTAALVVPGYASGTYTVRATGETSGVTVTATFTIVPTVTVSPSSGGPGTSYTAVATGFAPDEEVYVYLGSNFAAQCPADLNGECQISTTVPDLPYGPYTVAAYQITSTLEAFSTFDVAPTLSLSPSSGPAGSTTVVDAEGFSSGQTVEIFFDGLFSGACEAGNFGNCSTSITTAPESPGTYQVLAFEGGNGEAASAGFTVTSAAAMSLSPSSGEIDSTFTASLSNFAPGETVELYFAGNDDHDSCVVSTAGTCTIVGASVPIGTPGGVVTVAAEGSAGDIATSSFTVTPTLSVSPASGQPGASFDASVVGYAPYETVSFEFDGAPTGSACSTGATGSCTTGVLVPVAAAAGVATVAGAGSNGDSATASFTVLPPPAMALSPSSGQVGSNFSAFLSNFTAGETVELYFGGNDDHVSCLVSATGTCSLSGAAVPTGTAGGPVTVAAEGSAGDSATAIFTVTPTLTLSPASGSRGATFVAGVEGFADQENVAVAFGGTPDGTCTTNPTGSCTTNATVPAGAAEGAYAVTAIGQASGMVASATFTVTGPTVAAVAPDLGRTAGGTAVTITGSDFAAPATVHFGTAAATKVTVVNATTITATSPAGTGIVDVTVTTPAGTSPTSSADQFTYLAAPTVTAVSPASGPVAGGRSVTITGTSFAGTATVGFGATAATNVVVVNATTITATAPAGTAGTVNVVVTTAGGTSAASTADHFTYLAIPTVTKVSPAAGPTAGGTTVTITGTAFAAPATVAFGGVPATNSTVVNASTITATSPAGGGTVDVTVTTNGGTSAAAPADHFTYDAPPAVTAVTRDLGRTAGGTVVTISGSNFAGPATVHFGAVAATAVTVVNSTTITATSPAGNGTVDVTVTTPGGTSATSAADQFTYLGAPTVTAVSPASGPVAGGTSVTITGTNFAGTPTVEFGANAATNVVVLNSTTITATAPAGAAGVVNVTVTTAGGTSGTSAADRYTYH
jgi:hypothetical protein